MFAVIKTGGKQYRVAANDQFTIERVTGEAGDSVTFAEVLMVGTSIGAPFVAGASVVGEIVDQVRGPKVISFKKRRRQNSKRSRGHRQDLTLIRISEILTEGQKPSKKEKKAAAPAAEKAEKATSAKDDAAPEAKAEKPKKAAPKKAEAAEAAEAPKKPRATKKKADETEA